MVGGCSLAERAERAKAACRVSLAGGKALFPKIVAVNIVTAASMKAGRKHRVRIVWKSLPAKPEGRLRPESSFGICQSRRSPFSLKMFAS